MTDGRRTPQDVQRRRALADAAAGWEPKRGDLAYDTGKHCVGVVVALPEDTGTTVYKLRPDGGGDGWTAPYGRLKEHQSQADDGLTLDESAMPPDGFTPGSGGHGVTGRATR
ncbi:hypothetical protein [Streptomyces natalensis]|uniref:hypothetical protein n=1 Tax=Streptomyces natalensis TaxID=68242 RepID=UPI000ACE1225|nr:hypothetical protein [Streptomyces natalensis]